MRFFVIACAFCLIIASVGCMTNNWSSPLFKERGEIELGAAKSSTGDTVETKRNFWNSNFGEVSGVDPRAREIERRLGLN